MASILQKLANYVQTVKTRFENAIHNFYGFEIEQIKRNILRGRDPYGRPWPKRKYVYSHPTMLKSRALYNAFRHDGIKIVNPTVYFKRQNERFMMLPKRGIPHDWLEHLKFTFKGALSK